MAKFSLLSAILRCGLLSVVVMLVACSSPERPSVSTEPVVEKAWTSAWGTAIYTTFPNGPLSGFGAPPTGQFDNNEAVDQSFRMMIYPTVGGDRVRLQLSNVFGTQPLRIENISIAKRQVATGPAIDAASLVPVLVNGQSSITIPVGETVVTDVVEFSYAYAEHLAVNFHVPGPSGPMSWHAEAFATQYVSAANSGDVSQEASGSGLSNGERGWFFLNGMDVQIDLAEEPVPLSVVAFGDSITDGFVSIPDTNGRYPDLLAARIQSMNLNVGVINSGINSNSVNAVRDPITTGIAGTERFAIDVLQRAGVRSVFILLGTNDLSSGATADSTYAGLVNLAQQAHAAGICTVVSTILPRNDPPGIFAWDVATDEPQRQRLNELILTGGDFDFVTDDLATALENPAVENQPNNLLFVEGLHPNPAGMQVLADAIPLAPLLPAPYGSCARVRSASP
jgi:lysophospholipase L1-like esterase